MKIKNVQLDFKLVYKDNQEKLYELFMWLIGILSNEDIEKLCNSLVEYIKESEEDE